MTLFTKQMDYISMYKSIDEKALSLNLIKPLYGTIAEIGAGQEVARWFFKVGGAAGTIAKAMSAYDMAFSDDIYGKEKSGRYVVKSRVLKMLDHEYSLLESRLTKDQNDEKLFFAFANTVAAKSYKYQGDCHGWLGLRFQQNPSETPSQVFLHVRMLDQNNLQQQEALGVLGVNLIYACYNHHESLSDFLPSLMDGDLDHRIEINVIQLEGSVFGPIDENLLNLMLVKHGLTNAILLPSSGKPSHLGEELYEKQVIIHRKKTNLQKEDSETRPINDSVLESARKYYCGSKSKNLCDPYLIEEIYLNPEEKNFECFLKKVQHLHENGKNVILSSFDLTYKLTEFIAQWTDNQIAVVFRATKLIELFESKEPVSLDRLSRIFNQKTYMYIYPVNSDDIPLENRKDPTKKTFGLSDYKPSTANLYLFKHLIKTGSIQELSHT